MHTSARVDMEIALNATWEDAFQFGGPTDTTWSFSGQKFWLDIKGNIEDAAPALRLVSDAETFVGFPYLANAIVVDDAVKRVLHLNVDMATLVNYLLPWQNYVYDLIMIDGSSPAVRVSLMHGRVRTALGVTGS